MITCLGDVFFPEVGVAMVRLLRGLGVELDFPEAQTCCGMPLFNSGYHHDAAEVAARTVERVERGERAVGPRGAAREAVRAGRARGGAVRLLRVDGQGGVPGPAEARSGPARRRGVARAPHPGAVAVHRCGGWVQRTRITRLVGR